MSVQNPDGTYYVDNPVRGNYVTPTPGNSGPRQIPGGAVAPPTQPGGQDIYAMLAELRNQANTPEGVAAYHRAVYATNLSNEEKAALEAMRTYSHLTPAAPDAPAPSYTNTNQVSYTPTNYGSGSNSGSTTPSGGSGLNRPGGLPGTNPANNYSDPNWIMSQIANRGLNPGSNDLYNTIKNFSTSQLNPSSASPSGGTNPVLDDLYRRLGNVSYDQPLSLLTQFLGVGADGSYNGGQPQRSNAGAAQMFGGGSGALGSSYGASGAPGGIGDTVGGQNTYFAEQIRKFFDPSRLDPANDPTMQPYLDAINQQAVEAGQKLMGAAGARAEGTGRYGGGYYGKLVKDVGDATATDVANASAQALMGSRQAALAAQMEALDLINKRDQAAMADATNRYGITSSANASGASAAAQAASAAAQAALARRGQDLDAITALMGYQQNGLGSLQRLGEFNGTQQQNSVGNLGSLFGMEQSGWNQASNAADWMGQNYWTGQQFDYTKQRDAAAAQRDAAAAAAEAAANANAEAWRNKQWDWETGWQDQFNQNKLLQDWINGLAAIGGMGGSGTGSTTTPGAGINLGAATAQGALGGGLTGAGLARQYWG